MTTPNTAWALTYLHKTYAHLPQLAHFPIHIKNIYRIPKITKITRILTIPNFPTTNGGQTVGLQQAPPFPKEGFGEECKYNWRLSAGSASQAFRLKKQELQATIWA